MHLFRVRDQYADPKYDALEELAEMPFTSHNDAKLLINGREAFPAMFAGMEAAQDYIIVQFYIIRDDILGRQLKEILERKAREGVRVYVLFDEIGSYNLPRAYRRELAEAGVVILAVPNVARHAQPLPDQLPQSPQDRDRRWPRGLRRRLQHRRRIHGPSPEARPLARHDGRSPRPSRAGNSIHVS